MARYRKAFCLGLALALGLATSGSARAYEDQASLDLALGYTLLLDSNTLPEQGVALDLGGSFGISDIAIVRGLAGYAPLFDGEGIAHAGRLRVEALYLVDVLQFVPFFGLGANLLLADDRTDTLLLRPGGHIVLGADYLISRSLTIGLDVRTGVALERGEVMNNTDVSLRLSRMFETF
jgi:hypothetical protein